MLIIIKIVLRSLKHASVEPELLMYFSGDIFINFLFEKQNAIN